MAKTTARKTEELSVETRAEAGTASTKKLRGEGWVPGVVYGKDHEAVSVKVQFLDLARVLRSETGEHGLITLKLDGKRSSPALIKDVQHHPVDGHILHVDFQAVSLKEKIHVPVEIRVEGEPVGVKDEGGILEHFLREMDVQCLPTEIPQHITIDAGGLHVGESIHVSDVKPPENMVFLNDPESVIVSVVASRAAVAETETTEAAGAEPEVIREKKGEKGEPSPAAAS